MSSDDAPIETRAVSGLLAGGALTLVVLSGSRKGAMIPVGDKTRIGKADDNELVLGDDTVSRHHCELVREGSAVRVRDLGSTNGTRVDGTRVTDALLSPGAVLKVGEVEIALRSVAPRSEI
ncbi:MAG TPA: FHA domain-containing protein, partial [Polyangiaceae bacterium]|nr:FHA domain-containing protein [Polyangiaceae bacterium]